MNLDLVGRLTLFPGRPLPSIGSTRLSWVPRLARGRQADDWPAIAASLFTLCGTAHRMCAARAVAAARGARQAVTAEMGEALRLGAAREQWLRLSLDWPRALFDGPDAEAGAIPTISPLWRSDVAAEARWSGFRVWLRDHWLGMAPDAWLAAHDVDPDGWIAQWSESDASPAARLVRQCRKMAGHLATPHCSLRLTDDREAAFAELAQRMRDEAFCMQPTWDGGVPDTGPWSRHGDPVRRRHDNAGMRYVSRFVDLLRLAAPAGASWLAHGALPVGPHQGIAWTESARGLLVHWVCLDDEDEQLVEGRTVVPTDWNFHPRGVLAQSLSALTGAPQGPEARRLALAFDPCAPFDVVRHPVPEAADA